jgi:hypothetical protein
LASLFTVAGKFAGVGLFKGLSLRPELWPTVTLLHRHIAGAGAMKAVTMSLPSPRTSDHVTHGRGERLNAGNVPEK